MFFKTIVNSWNSIDSLQFSDTNRDVARRKKILALELFNKLDFLAGRIFNLRCSSTIIHSDDAFIERLSPWLFLGEHEDQGALEVTMHSCPETSWREIPFIRVSIAIVKPRTTFLTGKELTIPILRTVASSSRRSTLTKQAIHSILTEHLKPWLRAFERSIVPLMTFDVGCNVSDGVSAFTVSEQPNREVEWNSSLFHESLFGQVQTTEMMKFVIDALVKEVQRRVPSFDLSKANWNHRDIGMGTPDCHWNLVQEKEESSLLRLPLSSRKYWYTQALVDREEEQVEEWVEGISGSIETSIFRLLSEIEERVLYFQGLDRVRVRSIRTFETGDGFTPHLSQFEQYVMPRRLSEVEQTHQLGRGPWQQAGFPFQTRRFLASNLTPPYLGAHFEQLIPSVRQASQSVISRILPRKRYSRLEIRICHTHAVTLTRNGRLISNRIPATDDLGTRINRTVEKQYGAKVIPRVEVQMVLFDDSVSNREKVAQSLTEDVELSSNDYGLVFFTGHFIKAHQILNGAEVMHRLAELNATAFYLEIEEALMTRPIDENNRTFVRCFEILTQQKRVWGETFDPALATCTLFHETEQYIPWNWCTDNPSEEAIPSHMDMEKWNLYYEFADRAYEEREEVEEFPLVSAQNRKRTVDFSLLERQQPRQIRRHTLTPPPL